jgi:hypothetical protein
VVVKLVTAKPNHESNLRLEAKSRFQGTFQDKEKLMTHFGGKDCARFSVNRKMRRGFSSSIPVLVLFILFLPLSSFAQQATLTDDAYTASNSPNTNNGASTSLSVGVGSKITNSYLKFKLTPSLPPGTTADNIAKANLKLYVTSSSATGSFDVYRVNSAWTESTIKYGSAPSLGTLVVSAVPVTTANAFVVVDLTQLVKDWLNGPLNGGVANNGIALMTNVSATLITFDSKESTTTSHEPSLEIALVNPGPQGPTGPTGPQGPAGPAGMNWKGLFDATAAYQVGDAVSYQGSSWVAKTTVAAPPVGSFNPPPSEGLTWTTLAQSGSSTFPDGSVSSPGITFATETATGMYHPSASRIDFVTGGLSRAYLSKRDPDDGLITTDYTPNAGILGIKGENPDDLLAFTFFKYGANVVFRNSNTQLEFHGWNGTQYQPVLSLLAGAYHNQIQIRNRTDTNSLQLIYKDYGGPSIETEFGSTPITIKPSANLTLSPGSSITELVNGANPQMFQVYNSFIDGGNFERALLGWINNAFYVGTYMWGSGSAHDLIFVTGNNARWKVAGAGNFLPSLDNSYDIGQNGVARVRNIFAAGSISTSGAISTTSTITGKSVGVSTGGTTVTWTNGQGAPSGACSTGSMYTRTDGGPGSTLYVCEAGVWSPK